MNAYEMFNEIRDNIGEAAAAHWSDLAILRKINAAQRKAFHIISQTPGDWFIQKAAGLTPVSGLVSFPADCAKPVYMEDANNSCEIPINITVREKRVDMPVGFNWDLGSEEAFLLEDGIQINNTNFSGTVDLWYERRIPDLHFGTAAAGGAASLTLEAAKQHSLVDNYYNNLDIEIVSGTGAVARDTITDYTASSRVCVVTGTYSTDSVYGMISVLPREACDYMMLHATLALLAKPSSNADPNYFTFWKTQLKEAETSIEEWCSRRVKNSLAIRHVA